MAEQAGGAPAAEPDEATRIAAWQQYYANQQQQQNQQMWSQYYQQQAHQAAAAHQQQQMWSQWNAQRPAAPAPPAPASTPTPPTAPTAPTPTPAPPAGGYAAPGYNNYSAHYGGGGYGAAARPAAGPAYGAGGYKQNAGQVISSGFQPNAGSAGTAAAGSSGTDAKSGVLAAVQAAAQAKAAQITNAAAGPARPCGALGSCGATSSAGVRFSMHQSAAATAAAAAAERASANVWAKAPAPAPAPAASSDTWPASLRQWVERAFGSCHTDLERHYVEQALRSTIAVANATHSLWTKDWANEPLPAKKKELWLPPRSASPPRGQAASKASKRKQKAMAKAAAQAAAAAHSMKASRSRIDAYEVNPEEERKRQRRANRFEATGVSLAERAAMPDRWSSGGALGMADADGDFTVDYTVVGTCQELEKKYLRLTSAPDPRTVRPEPVLRKTLEHIRNRIAAFELDGSETQVQYLYLWEQMKSIRQDLTVQHVRNEFTVEVYEMHARICLEFDDETELKQCQAQLAALYEDGIGTREAQREFMAYDLLYNLGKQAVENVNKLMLQLTREDAEDKFIAHALKVREAATGGNYHRWFKLYASAPGHSAYLMDHFADRERLAALKVIVRSYMPSVPTSFVAEQLGYDGAEAVTECADFLRDHGAVLSDDGGMLDCKGSKGAIVDHSISARLEEERKEAQRKAEIVPISF